MTTYSVCDESAREEAVRRLGKLFAEIEKIGSEVGALVRDGALAEGFQLADIEELVSEAMTKMEIVRGANNDFDLTFEAAYSSAGDRASASRPSLR